MTQPVDTQAEEPVIIDVTQERVSHSRLSTYFECSWKWWVKYRNGDLVEETPMWAGVGGTAFHNATEELDLNESWRESTPEEGDK